jgi:hypothetical protein
MAIYVKRIRNENNSDDCSDCVLFPRRCKHRGLIRMYKQHNDDGLWCVDENGNYYRFRYATPQEIQKYNNRGTQ